MKCHVCGKNEATVQVKQAIGNETKELWLCKSCAEFAGIELSTPESIANFLIMNDEKTSDVPVDDKTAKCASCGMTIKDFRKTSRLGCPECYDCFEKEISEIIERVQNGDRHVGRVPKSRQIDVEIIALQEQLSVEIKAQNFEKAAELRDRIRDLKDKAVCCGIENEENNSKRYCS